MANTIKSFKGKRLSSVIRSRYLFVVNPRTGRVIGNHWARQSGVTDKKGAIIGLFVKNKFVELTSRRVIPMIKPHMLKARAKKYLMAKEE